MSRAEIQRSLFRRGRKPYRGPESEVLHSVIAFVNAVPGFRIWRQNTGGRDYIGSDGRKHVVFFGQKGQSDTTGIGRGLRVEIEVKRDGGHPDAFQHAWLDFIRAAGGIAFWCDSIEVCRMKLVVEFERRGWDVRDIPSL